MDSIDTETTGKVIDLMAALKKSIESSRANDTREEITAEAGAPDILDSRECVRCGMPMHMHPTSAPSLVVPERPEHDVVCNGTPPESQPLPFTIVEFRDEDQLDWYDYLAERPR